MACVTSTKPNGTCGPYTYADITGSTGGGTLNTTVGMNMFTSASGYSSSTETMTVTSPGDWSVVGNFPAGYTDVIAYPSVGQSYPTILYSDFSYFTGSFTENMNQISGTSAEAAFDVWFSSAGTGMGEMMIQHDNVNRGSVLDSGNGMDTIAQNISFGGTNGVPVHNWNCGIYSYPGSGTYETIWQLADLGGNWQSGSVDILAMVTWLVNNGDGYNGQTGYFLDTSALYLIGYGWEICSTNGENETFECSALSMLYSTSGGSPPPPPPPPPPTPPPDTAGADGFMPTMLFLGQ